MTYRNPVKVILLSVFTLGLYILYWLFVTGKEMKQKGINLPSIWVFALPFGASISLLFFVSVISLFLDSNSGTYNFVNLILFPILTMVLITLVIPLMIWWFWKYCGGIQIVTNGRLSQGTAFLIWLLLSLFGGAVVWPMIVQNYYNSERTTH